VLAHELQERAQLRLVGITRKVRIPYPAAQEMVQACMFLGARERSRSDGADRDRSG
jgi:hypothetical protein